MGEQKHTLIMGEQKHTLIMIRERVYKTRLNIAFVSGVVLGFGAALILCKILS